MSNVSSIARTAGTYARDLFERVLATFVVTAAGLLVAAGPADMLSASFWEGVGAAGLAAAGSLVKGIASRVVGDRNSASAAPGV
ncbi:hypothetical protein [Streptomyces synnematoformans]|uniref:Holin n=1 Tax=Streptomyces synnematoformans TaxID=415721 RepID=A0ABN2XD06_9ACTN